MSMRAPAAAAFALSAVAAAAAPAAALAFDCLPAPAFEPAVAAGPGPLAGTRSWSLVRPADPWPEGPRVPPATLPAGSAVDALRIALAGAGVRLAVAPGAWDGEPAPELASPLEVAGSPRSVSAAVSAAAGGGLPALWVPGDPGHVLVGAPPRVQLGLGHADGAALAAAAVRSAGGDGLSIVAGPGGGPGPALRFSAPAPVRERIEEALRLVDAVPSAAVLDGAFFLPGPWERAFGRSRAPDSWAAGPAGLEASAWDSPRDLSFQARGGIEPRRLAVPLGIAAAASPGECLAEPGAFGGSPEVRVGFHGWDPRDPSRLRLSFSLEGAPGSVEVSVAPGGFVDVRFGHGLPGLGARVRWRAVSGVNP